MIKEQITETAKSSKFRKREDGQKMTNKTKMRTKEITFIGLMGALSAVLMLFRFPIPWLLQRSL